MIKNILNQFIKLFGQEYLGEWDPIKNLTVNSVTSPEVLLTNVPFPEKLFELAELPFEIIYSNIKNLRIKFLWSSIFSNNISPINIYADDCFIVIKYSYPSLWDTNKIINHQYKQKIKKLQKWDIINILKEKKEDSFLKSLPVKLVNSLRILVENIRIVFFDNYIHKNPFTLEVFIKSFKIDELNKYKVKLTEEEKKNIKKNLLINIWIRLIGLQIIFKEYKKSIRYRKQRKKTNQNNSHNTKITKGKIKDELFLTANEDKIDESTDSVRNSVTSKLKRKKTNLIDEDGMVKYLSFSDYDIDDRIKEGYIKKKVKKKKYNFNNYNKKEDENGENINKEFEIKKKILSKILDEKQKKRKLKKANYNFEIPKHNSGFRITPNDGLDLHVIFKKYDIKSLNELNDDLKYFKNVELSFLNHNKDSNKNNDNYDYKNDDEYINQSLFCYNCTSNNTNINTDIDNNVNTLLSNNNVDTNKYYNKYNYRDKSDSLDYDKIMELNFKNDTPPMFSNINNHKSLDICFTTSSLDAFYNFIKYIELWFLYKGGCTKVLNIVPSIDDCIKYSEYLKIRNNKNYKHDEYIEKFIEKFEGSCPIHLLIKLKVLSADCIYDNEYFNNNEKFGKREWKKLLYNFIKNKKVNSSVTDENLEKLGKWFSHDMLFNLVIPKINFTYVPIKFNHFNDSKIKLNKCLLSYNINCSFLMKQEKLSTLKKKLTFYLHNLNIQSLFSFIAKASTKNKNFISNKKKKYNFFFIKKLPIINYCLYNEPTYSYSNFYSVYNDYVKKNPSIDNNSSNDILFPYNKYIKNGEIVNEKNIEYMMNFIGKEYVHNDAKKFYNNNYIDGNIIKNDEKNHHNIIKNNIIPDKDIFMDNEFRAIDNLFDENDNQNNAETIDLISSSSLDTTHELNKNKCIGNITKCSMCNNLENQENYLQSIDGSENLENNGVESMKRFGMENLDVAKDQEIVKSSSKYFPSINGNIQRNSQNNNNDGNDKENNENGKRSFWKFILRNHSKMKKTNCEHIKDKNEDIIDDRDFDRIINNEVFLIPNTTIITLKDYSNNIREIDIHICKYVINLNNLLPIFNFIPISNICLELFLKYDNYIDKDVIETICLCISSSTNKKKIIRAFYNEMKLYYIHNSYIQNEIVILKKYIKKAKKKKKFTKTYSQENFIEHDDIVDPFKSIDEKNEISVSKSKTKEKEKEKEHKKGKYSEMFSLRKLHSLNILENGDNNNIYYEEKDVNNQRKNINSYSHHKSYNLNEYEHYENLNLNTMECNNINNNDNEYNRHINKNICDIENNEKRDIMNINNLIFNNLFVPQKNLYHTKINNTFCYLKKNDFLYSIKNNYYKFLKKYVEYNKNHIKNKNILSIGMFLNIKNFFVFYNKEDSLVYLQANYIYAEHIFHLSFFNKKNCCINKDDVDYITNQNSNQFENKTQTSSIENINNTVDINGSHNNYDYKDEGYLSREYKCLKNFQDKKKNNKSMFICIKSLKIKKNSNVVSLKMNSIDFNINEICVSLLSIYKNIISFEYFEMIKLRIQINQRIRHFLIVENKNTNHLSMYNITNDLLYNVLNKHVFNNNINEESEIKSSKIENAENGENNESLPNKETVIQLNKNYEKYLKNLIIKILDNEKTLYSKEDFEKIFYMILSKKNQKIRNIKNESGQNGGGQNGGGQNGGGQNGGGQNGGGQNGGGQNEGGQNESGQNESGQNGSGQNDKNSEKIKIFNNNIGNLNSSSSNIDIIEYLYSNNKKDKENKTSNRFVLKNLRTSRSLEIGEECHTINKRNSNLSSNYYENIEDSYNNSAYFHTGTDKSSYYSHSGSDDYKNIGHNFEELNEEKIKAPLNNYYDKKSKYLNLRDLFNFDQNNNENTELVDGENSIISQNIPKLSISQIGPEKNDKIEEETKENEHNKKQSLFLFLLIKKINVSIPNKNEGMFQITCNELLSEISRTCTEINISMKMTSLYLFYLKNILNVKNESNMLCKFDEGVDSKKCVETESYIERKTLNQNICKKYVILTDTICNILCVSESRLKNMNKEERNKIKKDILNKYVCILKKKKFKLYIDYEKRKGKNTNNTYTNDKKNKINLKPQIHLDIHINKENNQKVIKLSLNNFNFFYSSTLFVLLYDVMMNLFLCHLQEREKMDILIYKYGSIIKNNFYSYIISSKKNIKISESFNTKGHLQPYLDTIGKGHFENIQCLEKWLSSQSIIDNLCSYNSSSEQINDMTYSDNVEYRNVSSLYNLTKNRDSNGSLMDNTFYYDLPDNKKNIHKKINFYNFDNVDNVDNIDNIDKKNEEENNALEEEGCLSDDLDQLENGNVKNGLYNQLYYLESGENKMERQNDTLMNMHINKKFIEENKIQDSCNNMNKSESNGNGKENTNSIDLNTIDSCIINSVKYNSVNSNFDGEENNSSFEYNYQLDNEKNINKDKKDGNKNYCRNRKCLDEIFHENLRNNNTILGMKRNNTLKGYYKRNEIDNEISHKNEKNSDTLKKYVDRYINSYNNNIFDQDKTNSHFEDNKNKSGNVKLLVCSENVNICYLINFYRFKYIYKKKYKLGAYMDEYVNMVDSCSNYCKKKTHKNKNGKSNEEENNDCDGNNFDHIAIMNKDLYNLNFNFLFKFDYTFVEKKKKEIKVFFPFLYILFMKNFNYIISHLTIVDVKMNSEFECIVHKEKIKKPKINDKQNKLDYDENSGKKQSEKKEEDRNNFDNSASIYTFEDQNSFLESLCDKNDLNDSTKINNKYYYGEENMAINNFGNTKDIAEKYNNNKLNDSIIYKRGNKRSRTLNFPMKQNYTNRNNTNNKSINNNMSIYRQYSRYRNNTLNLVYRHNNIDNMIDVMPHNTETRDINSEIEQNNMNILKNQKIHTDSLHNDSNLKKTKSYISRLFNYSTKNSVIGNDEMKYENDQNNNMTNNANINISHKNKIMNRFNSVINFMSKTNNSLKYLNKKNRKNSLNIHNFNSVQYKKDNDKTKIPNLDNQIDTISFMNIHDDEKRIDIKSDQKESICFDSIRSNSYTGINRDVRFSPYEEYDRYKTISQNNNQPRRSLLNLNEKLKDVRSRSKMKNNFSSKSNKFSGISTNNAPQENNNINDLNNDCEYFLNEDNTLDNLDITTKEIYNWNLSNCELSIYNINLFSCIYLRRLIKDGETLLYPLIYNYNNSHTSNFYNIHNLENHHEYNHNNLFEKGSQEIYNNVKNINYKDYINNNYVIQKELKFIDYINKLYNLEWFNKFNVHHLHNINKINSNFSNFISINNKFGHIKKYSNKSHLSNEYNDIICCYVPIFHKNVSFSYRNIYKFLLFSRYYENISNINKLQNKSEKLKPLKKGNQTERNHNIRTKNKKENFIENEKNKMSKNQQFTYFSDNNNNNNGINHENNVMPMKKKKIDKYENFITKKNIKDSKIVYNFSNDENNNIFYDQWNFQNNNKCNIFNNYLIYKNDFLKQHSWKDSHIYLSLNSNDIDKKSKENAKTLKFYINIYSSTINIDPYFLSTYNFYLFNNLNKSLIVYDIEETKKYFNRRYKKIKKYYNQFKELNNNNTNIIDKSEDDKYTLNNFTNIMEVKYPLKNITPDFITKENNKNIEKEQHHEDKNLMSNFVENDKLYKFMNGLSKISSKIKDKVKNNQIIVNIDINNIDINILDCSYIYDCNYLLIECGHPFYNNNYIYMSKEQYEKIKKEKNHNSVNGFEYIEDDIFSNTMNKLIYTRFTNYYDDNSFYVMCINEKNVKRISIQLSSIVLCNNINKYQNLNDVLSIIIYKYKMNFSTLKLNKIKNLSKNLEYDLQYILEEIETDDMHIKKKTKNQKNENDKTYNVCNGDTNSCSSSGVYQGSIQKRNKMKIRHQKNRKKKININNKIKRSYSNSIFYNDNLKSDHIISMSDFYSNNLKKTDKGSNEIYSYSSLTYSSFDDFEDASHVLNSSMGFNSKILFDKNGNSKNYKNYKNYKNNKDYLNRYTKYRMGKYNRKSGNFSDSMCKMNSISIKHKMLKKMNEGSNQSSRSNIIEHFQNVTNSGRHYLKPHFNKKKYIKKKKKILNNYIKKVYNKLTENNENNLIFYEIIQNNKWVINLENVFFSLPSFSKGFKLSLYINKLIIYDYNQINICNNIFQYRLFIKNEAEKEYLKLCDKILSIYNYLYKNDNTFKDNLNRNNYLQIIEKEIYNNQLYIIANENYKSANLNINVKNTRFTLHNKTIMNLINYFTEMISSIFSFLYVYIIYPEVYISDLIEIASGINVDNFQKGLLLYNNLLRNYINVSKNKHLENNNKFDLFYMNSINNDNIDAHSSDISQNALNGLCQKKDSNNYLQNKSQTNEENQFIENNLDNIFIEESKSRNKTNNYDNHCSSSNKKEIRKLSGKDSDMKSPSTINWLSKFLFAYKNKINYKNLFINKYDYQINNNKWLKELSDKNYYLLAFINSNLIFFLYFYSKYKTVLNYSSNDGTFINECNYTYPIKKIELNKSLVNKNKIYEEISKQRKFMMRKKSKVKNKNKSNEYTNNTYGSNSGYDISRKHSVKDQIKVNDSKIREKRKKEKKIQKIEKYKSYIKNDNNHSTNLFKSFNTYNAYDRNIKLNRNWNTLRIKETDNLHSLEKEDYSYEMDKENQIKNNNKITRKDINNVDIKSERTENYNSLNNLKNNKVHIKYSSIDYENPNKNNQINTNTNDNKKKEYSENGNEVKGLSRKIKTTFQKLFTRKLSFTKLHKNENDQKKDNSATNILKSKHPNKYSKYFNTNTQNGGLKKGEQNMLNENSFCYTSIENFRKKHINLKMSINHFEVWIIQDDLSKYNGDKVNGINMSYFLKKKKKPKDKYYSDKYTANSKSEQSKDENENNKNITDLLQKDNLKKKKKITIKSYNNRNLSHDIVHNSNKSNIKSFSSSNSEQNLNTLNIVKLYRNNFNTYMSKNINRQVFYMAKKVKLSKYNDENLNENSVCDNVGNINSIDHNTDHGININFAKNNKRGNIANRKITRTLSDDNTEKYYNEDSSEIGVSDLSDSYDSSLLGSEYIDGNKKFKLSYLLEKTKKYKKKEINFDELLGKENEISKYSLIKKRKIEYLKWKKKKNISDNNRNICLALLFSTTIYFREHKNADSLKFRMELNNFNIMLGKCYNFYEIHNKLKLYKGNNNLNVFPYNSIALDLNSPTKSRIRNSVYKNEEYINIEDYNSVKKKLEYGFYDNSNFYNIYYNEMQNIKIIKKYLKRKNEIKKHYNDYCNYQRDEHYNEIYKDEVNRLRERETNHQGNYFKNKKISLENNDFNYGSHIVNYKNSNIYDTNMGYINNSEKSSINEDDNYGIIPFKNFDKNEMKRIPEMFPDLLCMINNMNKILYKDRYNIFLNHNNNIFMPNIKDENDWLLNINYATLNINSQSFKNILKITFYDLLINITIDNIKELYKLQKNFIYNIYFASFYKNYLAFIKNIHIDPFEEKKNKSIIQKSNKKLLIKNLYLKNVSTLNKLNKQIVHKKLKLLKRKKKEEETEKNKTSPKDNEIANFYENCEQNKYNNEYNMLLEKSCNSIKDKNDKNLLNRYDNDYDKVEDGIYDVSGRKNKNDKKSIMFSNDIETFNEDKCKNVYDEDSGKYTFNGNLHNLIKEKTIFVHSVNDNKYIEDRLNITYNVRKNILAQNYNIYLKLVDSYNKLQELINIENMNTKYIDIIQSLKEKYVYIEMYKENLYYLYNHLYAIITDINNEKNIICRGLIFLKMLNCFYAYNNKYVDNLFYYLLIYSKYNKFPYYLCNIQKYFDYKYFRYFTDEICNTNIYEYFNSINNMNYNNKGRSTYNCKYVSFKNGSTENNIFDLNKNSSNKIINENMYLQKEIKKTIKKEEEVKENSSSQKNISSFVVSLLYCLYKPYLYKTGKGKYGVITKNRQDKKGFLKNQPSLEMNNNVFKDKGEFKIKNKYLIKNGNYSGLVYNGEEDSETTNSLISTDLELSNENYQDKEIEQINNVRQSNKNEISMSLEKIESNSSKNLNKTDGIKQRKHYLCNKRGKKIKIQFCVNNICLKTRQLNNEHILTLNIYDLNYYLYTYLYKYTFFFYNYNEHVSFYLNKNVKEIQFEGMYPLEDENKINKNRNKNICIDTIWYEYSGSDMNNNIVNYNKMIKDEIQKKKEKKKSKQKRKMIRNNKKTNFIKMELTFKTSLSTYDNMYNVHDNIINPITMTLLINEEFKHFPILHVNFYSTSINLNITTSFLYLYKYLYYNLNFKNDVNEVKNSNIEIYNDLHSEIIIFYKTRIKNNKYTWKLNIINKNEYHKFPCECLYFCINKKKGNKDVNSEYFRNNKNADDFIIANENDLTNVFKDISQLGFKEQHIYNAIAKEEKKLLYDNTQNVYDILYQFSHKMPFLFRNLNYDNKIINIIKKQSSWIYIGVLYTDDLYSRAYKVPNVKHKLLVEPEIIRNTWCLSIGTCIQIENNTGLCFRIYKEGKTKYFSRVNFKWKLRRNKKVGGNELRWGGSECDFENTQFGEKKKNSKFKKNENYSNKSMNKFVIQREKRKKKEKKLKNGDYINVLPFSKRAIPLFWLYDCSLPYIKILRKKEKNYNSKNIKNNINEENIDIESVPFHILYKLLNKYSLNNNNLYQKKLNISPSDLVFKSLLMFYCYVKVKDVPTQHIKETSYSYSVVIEPMVTIKNNLPNPMTIIISWKKEKNIFNINKNVYQKKLMSKYNYETNDDITKILKKEKLYALVLPHHYWCLPICTQLFYMKIFYHGVQIEKMNFICDYTNQVKTYFDYSNIKLPDLMEGLYSNNIKNRINSENHDKEVYYKKGNTKSANNNSGLNVVTDYNNNRNNDVQNKNRLDNSGEENYTMHNDEDMKRNINYLQYKKTNYQSNIARNSILMHYKIINDFENGENKNDKNYSSDSVNSEYGTNLYDNIKNIQMFDCNDEINNNNNFLYATEQFFPIYMPSTDTITSTKVLFHKYGLIGNIFTYDELKFIYFENKISHMNKKIYDNLHVFKTINISTDMSRRKIDFYFPFFFENTTNVCICLNNKLLPPNSRLYMTEEEAKNIRIKSYKHDNINNKILCSNVSGKIDCTKTNVTRPLINLIYRKINRKQKVRFWGKYEQIRKSYENVINLKNQKEIVQNVIDKSDKTKYEIKILEYIKKQNIEHNQETNTENNFVNTNSSMLNDSKEINTLDKRNESDIIDKEIECATNDEKSNDKEIKDKSDNIENIYLDKNYDAEIPLEHLQDSFFNSNDKKDVYNLRDSNFSDISEDTNRSIEKNNETKNKSKKNKRYINPFKTIMITKKILFAGKKAKKTNESVEESNPLDKIKKKKRFTLFKMKTLKKNKANDEPNDEFIDDFAEQDLYERNDEDLEDSDYDYDNTIKKKNEEENVKENGEERITPKKKKKNIK
ncbi:hypothetical protein YYC_01011 [Plasmodium yoelii 17X]|uniref:Uncharacterized protein n=1 Tax=Plasmodium yoelii 17X TaxID=1323249 RepID=V7PSD9_PLAYE|nr:hypothetical protein YYC_01011 [Plasmodium yoelii 17X]